MVERRDSGAVELWPTVAAVLADISYLVLGTADADGHPWVSPVFFAARDEDHLYWVSSPDSRHSRNITVRPTVAITVFDSRGAIGVGDALYLSGTATARDGEAAADALAVLNAHLPDDRLLADDDLLPHGALLVYEATIDRHEVLIRGGDARFDNEIDTRLQVHRPPAH